VAAGLQRRPRENRHERLEGAHIVAVLTRTTATARRSNRVLILLAAAWMAVSLAIGGRLLDAPSTNPPPGGPAAADQADQP
jgi:hypothetical protein